MGNEIAVALLLVATEAAVQHSEPLRVDKSLRSLPYHSRPFPFVSEAEASPPMRERSETDGMRTAPARGERRDLRKNEPEYPRKRL